MSVKAVIFDWGGVMAPNPNGGWLGVLADRLGLTIQESLPYWHDAGYSELSKGLINEEEFWRRFELAYGKPTMVDKSQIWIDGSALTPWPEMLEFVESLKAKGLTVAVLSNTVAPLSRIARSTNLFGLFDHIVLSNEVGMVKPENEIYELVVSRLGVEANDCIFIDDLPKNLAPARRMGMHVILANDEVSTNIAAITEVLDRV